MHDADFRPFEAEAPLDAYSRPVANVIDRVGGAVVRVAGRDGSRRGGPGSGVVIAGADDLVRRLGHDAIGRPLEARAIRGGRIERRTVVTRERR